jgi:hypothetical protein
MRKVVLFGIVLICVTAASFLSVTPVERKILNPDGTVMLAAPAKPTQVEVTNFPAVQPVSGVVNVGNLPAVQSVAGTVAVGNLPLDADGNLRVASAPPPPTIRFAGYTAATFREGTGLLALNRACHAEFSGTRVCGGLEIVNIVPPPPVIVPDQGNDPSLPGYAFLVSYVQNYPLAGGTESGAAVPFSSCMSALGAPFDCGGLPMVVACCGF